MKPWADVHGNEIQAPSRMPPIKSRYLRKALLEGADEAGLAVVGLGEDNYITARKKQLLGPSEGLDYPSVVPNRNGSALLNISTERGAPRWATIL